jgi:hypothetical protein
MLTIAIVAVLAGIGVAPPERTTSSVPTAAAPAGIETIDHIIIVVQENRSFDHYFGTYPGADGIPRTDGRWDVCLPDPVLDRCARPYHSTIFFDARAARTTTRRRCATSTRARWMASSRRSAGAATRASVIRTSARAERPSAVRRANPT